MNRLPRNVAPVFLSLGLLLGLVVLAPTAEQAQPSDFTRMLHDSMAKMMDEMEQTEMTGDSDRDFLAMMIPHHAGAIEMARLELIHGRDPLVRRLAEEILASQQAEIEAMRGRLAILKERNGAESDGFPAIHGTRGERDKHKRGGG